MIPLTAGNYLREKIENWVADFCHSDALSDAVPNPNAELRANAPAALTQFLWAACANEGRDVGELEQEDVNVAFLESVAPLQLPQSVHERMPRLCSAFLAFLEREGRLSGGREMGSYLKAQRARYAELAAGKPKPLKNPGSKLGRNDPCPCGSGKKYKKCCLNKG